MRASAAALAAILACAACGGSKKPAPVVNVVTGEPPESSPAAPEPPGDARTIQRTQNGGVVELQGNHADAMAAAQKQFDAHCGPNNATITQEGEEVIGDTDASPAQTAWRVYYSCAGGSMPPTSP
jgi:hypothetical protein